MAAILLLQSLYFAPSKIKIVETGHSQINSPSTTIFALIAFNAGLLLVDHIHFQYNGVLLGILVLTIFFCSVERYLLAAVAFSVLVLMKHLYITLTPVFVVFLIKDFCLDVTASVP